MNCQNRTQSMQQSKEHHITSKVCYARFEHLNSHRRCIACLPHLRFAVRPVIHLKVSYHQIELVLASPTQPGYYTLAFPWTPSEGSRSVTSRVCHFWRDRLKSSNRPINCKKPKFDSELDSTFMKFAYLQLQCDCQGGPAGESR